MLRKTTKTICNGIPMKYFIKGKCFVDEMKIVTNVGRIVDGDKQSVPVALF